jgi:glycerophosphoryl diester phosphodiesterase
LELKFHGHESAFIRNAIEALREADFQDHCIVTSLNIPGLNEFRRQAPEFRVGAILAQVVGRPLQLQAEVLAVSTRMATSDLIDAAHRVNKEVHVWTVNDPLQLGRFADLGVDSIMTDDPVLLAEVLTQRAEMSRESRLLLKVRARLLH